MTEFERRLDEALSLNESKCPACGNEAYVGLNDVECTNPQCQHYKQTEQQITTSVVSSMKKNIGRRIQIINIGRQLTPFINAIVGKVGVIIDYDEDNGYFIKFDNFNYINNNTGVWVDPDYIMFK